MASKRFLQQESGHGRINIAHSFVSSVKKDKAVE
jgi:hypothetical protein